MCIRLEKLYPHSRDSVPSSQGEKSSDVNPIGCSVAPDKVTAPANRHPSTNHDRPISDYNGGTASEPSHLLNMRSLWFSTMGRWFNRGTKTKFPLEYGFYVGMGGFQAQVDASRNSKSFQVPTGGRMAITPCGILELGRAGVFLSLDCQTICDKSQVDVIARALTMFQVTWLVMEVSPITFPLLGL